MFNLVHFYYLFIYFSSCLPFKDLVNYLIISFCEVDKYPLVLKLCVHILNFPPAL